MPPLGKMILRRLLWVFPVAFGVVTMTFFMARVLNGDPTELYAPPEASDALRAEIRAKLGLADPLPLQFIHYLWDLLRLDLGTSFTTGQSVASDLWDRLPATLELGLDRAGAGHRRRHPARRARRRPSRALARLPGARHDLERHGAAAILGRAGADQHLFRRSLPGCRGRSAACRSALLCRRRVTGFLLIDTLLAGKPDLWWLALKQLALPALTLGFSSAAPIARVTRSAMAEALQSDYVRTAIAMGHGRRSVWFRYSLRNALLPVVTLIGGVAGHIFAGAVLLELIFAWPGLGQYALQAIERSDFAALQGFVIYASLLYVLAFLLVDLLYMFIDPRIRA